MPEIEITIKVNICSRCHHLWERRKGIGDGDNHPLVCPSCNSPYWDSVRTRGMEREKAQKKLIFHGEEVLSSNIEEVQYYGGKKQGL